ncbi:hypothetical protein [Pseudohoeflea coraliihabitans]|uniref:Uncharacterized protein n=1 Tax=Pseudohoeflea coraliihabitans TaxID=2860393 RepID=A0ABS6WKR6_9HYPH|nr:hypothetical protein [Pseudohoeflea sp. DP4N28-3]MBW3096243.1 hypothetical protein [Pseudohoeflea sp. DP4N28-3]
MRQQPEFMHTVTAEKELLSALRGAARGREILFHGTSYGSLIARTDTLLVPRAGAPAVALTRSPEVAILHATLTMDNNDGIPTVFMFDRQSLKTRYRIEPHADAEPWEKRAAKSEMEERVWLRDIRPISRHLITIFYCVGDRVYEQSSLTRFAIIADLLARARIAAWQKQNGYRAKTLAV